MDAVLALTIVCILYGIGDYISCKTKAAFSMIFTTSALFLFAFWVGLPKTIFTDASLINLGNLLVALLIVHMGTLMEIRDLLKQWRTVIISVAAVAGIIFALYFVGIPIVGKEYAISSAAPIAGGFVSTLIMGEAAKAKGLSEIEVFVTLILVLQSFFGYPIASLLLKREAKRVLKNHRGHENSSTENEGTSISNVSTKFRIIPPLRQELQTPFILLAKIAIAALISVQLAALFDNVIHRFIVCLIIGIIGREIGFLEENVMQRSNSMGLGMLALLSVIFANLVQATPAIVLSLLKPLIITHIIGIIGILLFTVLLSKILGYSKEMSAAIGLSALFGFPGTFILSNEVAHAVGENEGEKKAILGEILPKMIVAGFMTVTVSSVILAGIIAKWL